MVHQPWRREPRGWRWPHLASFLIASVGVLGCSRDAIFLCALDEHCETSVRTGVCQASGYCSFEDPECESGQRYGSYAPEPLAQACVELDTGATSSESGVDVLTGTSETGTLPDQGTSSTGGAEASAVAHHRAAQ